jgi:CheY-like chemotaxis protein
MPLNLNLPRVTGIEVLQTIRKDPTVPSDILPVVFSSSQLDDDKSQVPRLVRTVVHHEADAIRKLSRRAAQRLFVAKSRHVAVNA